MAWIQTIEKKEANGELSDLYKDLIKKRGKLSNIIKIQSLNPAALQAHMALYMSIMFQKSGLKRKERELIAVVVSGMNKCNYCIQHHAEALNYYWKNDNKIQKVFKNYSSSGLSNRQLAILDYSVKLTRTPNALEETSINKLRNTGFPDEDILNINLITSYFNFVNRIVLGLGVEFMTNEVSGYKY